MATEYRKQNGWFKAKSKEEQKAYTKERMRRQKEKYKSYVVRVVHEDATPFEEKCKQLGITPTNFFREQVKRFLKGY